MHITPSDGVTQAKFKNDLIYKNQGNAIILMIFVIALILQGFKTAVPEKELYIWGMILALSYVARYGLYAAYVKADSESQSTGIWEKRFTFSVLASGLIWGSAAIFIYPENAVIHQAVLLVTVAVIGVATMVTHAAYRRASQVFVLASMLPLIIRLFGEADAGHSMIGGILVLLTFLLLVTAKNLNLATLRIFDLYSENSELVAKLDRRNKELVETNSSLSEARDEAESASQAKSLFLANMSHEIRTPINGILSMVQVLDRTPLDEAQKNYLHTLERSGHLLTTLLDELLDLSKIESGKLELHEEGFDTVRWVSDINLVTEAMFQTGTNSLSVQVDKTLPLFLYGDGARLHQIVTNLIGNAVKYTSEGTVTLKVGGEFVSEDRYTLVISVSDTGVGIPDEYQRTIFDVFQQLSSRGGSRHGVGLGLAICKRLVDAMHGTISVESEKNRGSHFRVEVTLPVVEGISSRPDITDGTEEKYSPLTILLVDDDPVSRVAVKTIFTDKGHRVVLSTNGEEGIEKLQSEQIDVVLMDVHMPVMDGVEATKIIRSFEKFDMEKLPILGMTASVMKAQRQEYIAAGMNDVIKKPVDYMILSRMLENISARK